MPKRVLKMVLLYALQLEPLKLIPPPPARLDPALKITLPYICTPLG